MAASPVGAEAEEVVVEVGPGSALASLSCCRFMMRLVPLVSAVLVAMSPLPSMADETGEFPTYTGEEFQALYEYAVDNTLPNLEPPDGLYPVTGDESLDARIWSQAFARGYELRPTAMGDLARVGGVPMQHQAAEAWTALREEARGAGMSFIVSSAYRSPDSQRTQFLSKLNGTSESAIDATLTWYSVPGASKHHAGYTLDFRYADGTFGSFRSTPDYAWLAADNFAMPKRHGLIPSYPDDVDNQGPNPEPWEFVWVGTALIHCGLPQDVATGIEGPAAALVADIGRCPGGMAPATLPDWLS